MGYATVTDFYTYGLRKLVLGNTITEAQIQAALDVRSSFADTKFRARYKLPFQAPIDVTIVQSVCILTAYDLLVMRGFNPDNPADANIELRAKAALKWLDDVERQAAHPNVIEATSPSPALAAPLILSDNPQGWIPTCGRGSGIPG